MATKKLPTENCQQNWFQLHPPRVSQVLVLCLRLYGVIPLQCASCGPFVDCFVWILCRCQCHVHALLWSKSRSVGSMLDLKNVVSLFTNKTSCFAPKKRNLVINFDCLRHNFWKISFWDFLWVLTFETPWFLFINFVTKPKYTSLQWRQAIEIQVVEDSECQLGSFLNAPFLICIFQGSQCHLTATPTLIDELANGGSDPKRSEFGVSKIPSFF